jgi:hypothetical protein
MLATSAMTGQATFSLDEDEVDGVLAVSAGFFAAGLSADRVPFELDSLEVDVAEPASLDDLSLAATSAGTVPFFLLSVR